MREGIAKRPLKTGTIAPLSSKVLLKPKHGAASGWASEPIGALQAEIRKATRLKRS